MTLGFPFFTTLRHPGERAIRPREGLSTPLARRVGHGTRYFPGIEKGCCVGGKWRDGEAAGGQKEVESRSCFLGMLLQKCFQDPFGYHHHYYRGAPYYKDTHVYIYSTYDTTATPNTSVQPLAALCSGYTSSDSRYMLLLLLYDRLCAQIFHVL